MPMTAESTTHHSLLGSSVLVAGATGGLGRAMAGELHTRGATLTLVGRDPRRLADLSPEVLEELFAVNVFVPILLARAALPVARPPRGDRQPLRGDRRA
jgi:NAD(P)-dependent dehydrogenase (short-subunit alcohol dehydrogenase family)